MVDVKGRSLQGGRRVREDFFSVINSAQKGIDNIGIEIGAQIGVGDRERTEYGGVYPNAMLTVTGYF